MFTGKLELRMEREYIIGLAALVYKILMIEKLYMDLNGLLTR